MIQTEKRKATRLTTRARVILYEHADPTTRPYRYLAEYRMTDEALREAYERDDLSWLNWSRHAECSREVQTTYRLLQLELGDYRRSLRRICRVAIAQKTVTETAKAELMAILKTQGSSAEIARLEGIAPCESPGPISFWLCRNLKWFQASMAAWFRAFDGLILYAARQAGWEDCE